MIFIIFCCILSLMLNCRKFGTSKNYPLFRVKFDSSILICVKNMKFRNSVWNSTVTHGRYISVKLTLGPRDALKHQSFTQTNMRLAYHLEAFHAEEKMVNKIITALTLFTFDMIRVKGHYQWLLQYGWNDWNWGE